MSSLSDLATHKRNNLSLRLAWDDNLKSVSLLLRFFFGGQRVENTCFESLMNVFVSFIANAVMTASASGCYANEIKYDCLMYSPRSTILPNKFLPRRKLRVEQFHRRFLN